MNEKIPYEWFRRAKKESDPYFKFMSIYVALNFLYNSRPEKEECERMRLYLMEVTDEIGYRKDLASESEFLKSSVKNLKKHKNPKHKGPDEYYVKKGDLESLFKAIYAVRCNLFHGNKMLGDVRDKALVEEAANILIEILSSELEIADC